MKTPRASEALRQALDLQPTMACFAYITPLCYIGNFGFKLFGVPPNQILDLLLVWHKLPGKEVLILRAFLFRVPSGKSRKNQQFCNTVNEFFSLKLNL